MKKSKFNLERLNYYRLVRSENKDAYNDIDKAIEITEKYEEVREKNRMDVARGKKDINDQPIKIFTNDQVFEIVHEKTGLYKMEEFDVYCITSILKEVWDLGGKFRRWYNDLVRERRLREQSIIKPKLANTKN